MTLRMRERILGPDHHQVGLALSNIGYSLAQSGQCERAIPYLLRAREINERVLGPGRLDAPRIALYSQRRISRSGFCRLGTVPGKELHACR